jgi:hypothetical protein
VVRTGSIAGWIETLGQDLRYAARGLCKAPAFTLVAVLTLALGIGGTTTIFSAVDALLLRPLPYPDQNRLVALSTTYPKFQGDQGPVSATDAAHWRADNRVFEQIECASWPDMVVQGYFNYYAVPGNIGSMRRFRHRLLGLWWHTLCRRSQQRVPWKKMLGLQDRWFPEPRALHPYPAVRFAANHPR